MDKELLKSYIEEGLSSYTIAKKLDFANSTIKYWIEIHNLEEYYKIKRNECKSSINKDLLEKYIKESKSINNLLKLLGLNTSSGNYKVIKKAIKLHNFDISHFLSHSEIMSNLRKQGKLNYIPSEDLFLENSIISRSAVKNRIIKEKLIVYRCSLCNMDDNWRGSKLSLILDHINGISNDNRLENLRFVCPNCNATLKTHCRGNTKT